MNISDIITAFGTDERLDYNALAPRLGLDTYYGCAYAFSRKLKKFNIRTKQSRVNGRIVRAYERSHFEQVARTKQPYWQYEITL